MYADEGVTGTAAYKRKAFMEIIRDAYDGKFNMILSIISKKVLSEFSA